MIVTIPEPIPLVNPETDQATGVSKTFWQYLASVVFADLRWAKGYPLLKRRAALMELFRKAEIGSQVAVDIPDLMALRECITQPQLPFAADPHLLGQMLPFMAVFMEEKDVTPNG
jgi:hypothetical protein